MNKYIIASKNNMVPVPREIIANIPGINITTTFDSMRHIIFVESDYTLEEIRERIGDSFHIEVPQEYKVL